MPSCRIYLLHPPEQNHPGMAMWVDDVRGLLQNEESWHDWELLATPYDEQNNFPALPLFGRVLNKPGPVVLIQPVQRKPLEILRNRLHTRSIVLVSTVSDSTDLWQELEQARRRFESGEPYLPRKYIVAVLLVRKLRKGNYWAGKDKGYLWGGDLAKGRGVDERYADVIHEVANDLLQHQILITKTSQGKKKYALNPGRKPEVHAIANDGTFWNKHLEQILMRDTAEESACRLNEPRTAQRFHISGQGQEPFQCTAIAEAVAYARVCRASLRYEVRIEFQGDHVLQEIVEERHILIQFLEGFQ